MKNRSKLMIVAAVAASCVLLAGCGSSASSTASSAASSESAPSSVVLSQVESALPDDGTNSSDELADEVNTLLEANPIANQFEIAAMNNRQKKMGYNTAEEFNQKLMQSMGVTEE